MASNKKKAVKKKPKKETKKKSKLDKPELPEVEELPVEDKPYVPPQIPVPKIINFKYGEIEVNIRSDDPQDSLEDLSKLTMSMMVSGIATCDGLRIVTEEDEPNYFG